MEEPDSEQFSVGGQGNTHLNDFNREKTAFEEVRFEFTLGWNHPAHTHLPQMNCQAAHRTEQEP